MRGAFLGMLQKNTKPWQKKWDGDGHSHSYFNLKELKNYDWNKGVTCRGMIEEKEFTEWIKGGRKRPKSYCTNMFGSKIRTVTEQELNNIIAKNINREKDASYCVEVEWNEKCSDVGSFYNEFIPWASNLGISEEDIRIVFFFDN